MREILREEVEEDGVSHRSWPWVPRDVEEEFRNEGRRNFRIRDVQSCMRGCGAMSDDDVSVFHFLVPDVSRRSEQAVSSLHGLWGMLGWWSCKCWGGGQGTCQELAELTAFIFTLTSECRSVCLCLSAFPPPPLLASPFLPPVSPPHLLPSPPFSPALLHLSLPASLSSFLFLFFTFFSFVFSSFLPFVLFLSPFFCHFFLSVCLFLTLQ